MTEAGGHGWAAQPGYQPARGVIVADPAGPATPRLIDAQHLRRLRHGAQRVVVLDERRMPGRHDTAKLAATSAKLRAVSPIAAPHRAAQPPRRLRAPAGIWVIDSVNDCRLPVGSQQRHRGLCLVMRDLGRLARSVPVQEAVLAIVWTEPVRKV